MRISDWSSDVCSSDLVEVGSSNDYIDVTADSPLLTGTMFSFRPTYELNDDGAEAVSTAVADAFAACETSKLLDRSEERRVGKECVSTFRSRWSLYKSKKNRT